jgi:hypothetical protein
MALPLLDAMVPALAAKETAHRQTLTPLAARQIFELQTDRSASASTPRKELSHVKSFFSPSLVKSPSFNPHFRDVNFHAKKHKNASRRCASRSNRDRATAVLACK